MLVKLGSSVSAANTSAAKGAPNLIVCLLVAVANAALLPDSGRVRGQAVVELDDPGRKPLHVTLDRPVRVLGLRSRVLRLLVEPVRGVDLPCVGGVPGPLHVEVDVLRIPLLAPHVLTVDVEAQLTVPSSSANSFGASMNTSQTLSWKPSSPYSRATSARSLLASSYHSGLASTTFGWAFPTYAPLGSGI